ncbi:hypothetical protein L1987_47259 [Smallanthus sonchifolius]|uniref:Uncharacterized protein n=1 Tax=Smallanthus sonchifolius TaxID=185202 RepID=A0ACB9G1F9_9ASTR|nr:hypothetical protein L1987_47259 [Smallanthus sonchifolius]
MDALALGSLSTSGCSSMSTLVLRLDGYILTLRCAGGDTLALGSNRGRSPFRWGRVIGSEPWVMMEPCPNGCNTLFPVTILMPEALLPSP